MAILIEIDVSAWSLSAVIMNNASQIEVHIKAAIRHACCKESSMATVKVLRQSAAIA